MDRDISHSEKRKKKYKRIFKISFWFIGFIIFIVLLRLVIKPSINRNKFQTVLAVNGNIEASVTASGTILPEFEEIKTSPVQSKIVKIYHNVGDKLNVGDSVLALDKSNTKSNLEKLKDELNVKKNNVNQLKLKLERDLIDLKTQYEIKKLQVENMETELEEEKYLDKIGGGTKEKIEKAELQLKISRLELVQIKQTIKNSEESMKADVLGLNYEISIQQKSVDELQDRLNQATITAGNEGVITWINDQIGKNVNVGDELVKIANLQSYEVTGSISDMHAEKLHIGGNVIVRINEKTEIRGNIVSISPTVTGNIIQFKIKLDEKNHPLLRPNLKVDVFVITSFRENTICIKNGAFYKGGTKQMVFIVEGNKLVRKELEFGVNNFDYVEIINGLNIGDEIVVSDLDEIERYNEIKIKD
ncbi:MAG: HlyD family efflux transporter periplasmic adaptor subunit [Bacteroidales bacterium]|nr:HlyD family efflux transporter periplasmic adaptor subunit [Bacteroidales bacterium]